MPVNKITEPINGIIPGIISKKSLSSKILSIDDCSKISMAIIHINKINNPEIIR